MPPTAAASATAEPEMPPKSVAGGDVDLAEAAADVADQRAGEGDDAAGDAAADHQVAGEDEEGDRHQREDRRRPTATRWKTTSGGRPR